MDDRLLTSVAVIVSGYVISSLLIYPVRSIALRFGVLDRPSSRKCHSVPVPRMGGLAIFGSMAIVVWGSLLCLPHMKSTFVYSILPGSLSALTQYPLILGKLWAVFAGAVIITVIGLLDDVMGEDFPAPIKLAGEICAVIPLIYTGIYLDLLNQSPFVGIGISVIWLVGITNSFNLLDNMDGLSSGIALICSLVFLALVMLKGEFFIALLLSALIGSTLGFYQFNIRGGYIFMGDSGSLLLGYMLGAISLMARYVDPLDASIFPVLAPVIILGFPLFDTFSVIMIRLREGRPVFKGDQMHLSHRLARLGMTKRQAVLFNYLMALTIALNALLIINSQLLHSFVAVFQVAALAAMVSVLMNTQARNGDETSQSTNS